jgi:hypothetical protein
MGSLVSSGLGEIKAPTKALPKAPARPAVRALPRAPVKAAAPVKPSNPFAGVPKPLEGAPVLQRTYKNIAAPPKAAPRITGKIGREIEANSSIKGLPKAPSPKSEGGGLSLGSILSDVPKEVQGTGVLAKGLKTGAGIIGKIQTKGYENLLGSHGVGGDVAQIAGNTARDVVELPAQVLPALYTAGKAGVKGLAPPGTKANRESGDELNKLVHGYTHESAIGNLLTGNVSGAVSAAKRNPLYAGLEVAGGAGALDRVAGAAARSGALGSDLAASTKLADAGATTVSRAPQELLGNTKAPLDPYSKRLTTRLREGKSDPTLRPGESILEKLRGKSLTKQLEQHFDRQTGTLEAVRRNSRSAVVDARMKEVTGKPVKGAPLKVPIPGSRAVNAFARGLLADPKVLNEHGTPLYRDQLSRLVELHAKPVDGELPAQAHARMGKVAEYQAMLDDPRLQRTPEVAHKAAVKYAQDMRKLEPELVKHDYLTPQSIRVAKLSDPFQFHWQGQDPRFEEQPPFNARGRTFVAAEKARDEAYKAREGSRVEVNRAQAEHTAQLRLAKAQHDVTQATAVEKARNLIDLANRPGTEAEGKVAELKLGQLKAKHGLTDLTKPPELPRARATLEKVRSEVGRAGSLAEAKAALDDAVARHKANIAAHAAAVAAKHRLTSDDPMDLHESPFSVAGVTPGTRRYIPIDELEKTLLEKHGVDPKNIGFVSNRPFVNDSAAYYRSNTDPQKAGFNPQKQRTGAAFLRGQYDTSHDALVRQHLTNQGLVDQARGSKMQVATYALTKEHVAKLLGEKVDQLPPHEQTPVRALIAELRSGSTYFEAHGGSAGWDHAMRAVKEVEHLHPDLKLQPGRIAHPYAPAKQLDGIAKHTLEAVHDRLDPALWEQDRGTDRFPQDETQQRLDSGPIGVYHKAIADRMKAYERDTGSTMKSLLRMPSSWWRRANIAFSTKHIFGLTQELGIRAGVNKIGPLSYLRGLRLLNLVEQVASDPEYLKEHPEAALNAQRLKADLGGTVANQTQNLTRHVSENQLATTVPGAIAKAFRVTSERKLLGAPLRAVKGVVDAYSGLASRILSGERQMLEHPAQIAGLGKHANDEARRMMSKSLPVFGAVTDVERQMGKGLLSTEGVDHAARQLVEYWGDWTSASPRTKNILMVAPFWNWYRNSLRFLYATMPMHHPVKTALLTTLESATAQQRRAMGQGHGATEKLEPEQQGGIPIGGGYIADQQYYTPQGAVTDPSSTLAGLLLPEFSEAYKTLTGSNSYGETLENAKKEPITDPGERMKLAALALFETFNPLVRDAATIAQAGKSAETGSTLWDLKTKSSVNEDPIGRALGIPAGVYNAFRPFKTTKERTEKGETPTRGASAEPSLPTINIPTVNLPTVKIPTINAR